MVGQETRARGSACQLETFVMVSTCFAVGAKTRKSLQRSREKHGDTAGHGNGKNDSRVGSASRSHGVTSGRQCGHWNHRQAGIGKVRHLDLSELGLLRGKQVTMNEVQSESNVADFGTRLTDT